MTHPAQHDTGEHYASGFFGAIRGRTILTRGPPRSLSSVRHSASVNERLCPVTANGRGETRKSDVCSASTAEMTSCSRGSSIRDKRSARSGSVARDGTSRTRRAMRSLRLADRRDRRLRTKLRNSSVSSSNIKCHQVLSSVIKYYQVSSSIIKCHTFLNNVNYCQVPQLTRIALMHREPCPRTNRRKLASRVTLVEVHRTPRQ